MANSTTSARSRASSTAPSISSDYSDHSDYSVKSEIKSEADIDIDIDLDMPSPYPPARLQDLTWNLAVKLVRYPHFLEPTDREVHKKKDSLSLTPGCYYVGTYQRWDTFKALTDCVRDDHCSVDEIEKMSEYGIAKVGLLKGTKRVVYAVFDHPAIPRPRKAANWLGCLSDVEMFSGGAFKITLVAGPFVDRSRDNKWTVGNIASEAEMNNQHGSSGFIASAEVLDWNLVEFFPGCRADSLEECYAGVCNALDATGKWA